jgi:hypothetical protein
MDHSRIDRAGAYSIDAHAGSYDFSSRRLGKANHGVLRGVVGQPAAPGRHDSRADPAFAPRVAQRGSGGNEASVANRNTVVERNSSPGFSSVVGKFGLFGLSGKCCVSRVNASV